MHLGQGLGAGRTWTLGAGDAGGLGGVWGVWGGLVGVGGFGGGLVGLGGGGFGEGLEFEVGEGLGGGWG